MALGNKATDAQIVKAEQQADAIWRSQQAIKAAAEEEKKRTQASQNFTSLQGQVSPVAAVDNSYLTQMAQLNEYVTLYPQKIAEAEALRASIEEQYHQRRMAAMWEEWQQQSQINSMIGAAVDSLAGWGNQRHHRPDKRHTEPTGILCQHRHHDFKQRGGQLCTNGY